MFKELNSKSTIQDNIDINSLPFVKLKDCEGETLKVKGFFFTNGDYGKQVVVVTPNKKVNMPQRAVSQFENIKNDQDMLDAVLEGHLMITGITPKKTKRGSTTDYTLEDC